MRKIEQTPVTTEPESCRSADHQSMHRAMTLIGDRWTLAIVYSLLGGSKRFGELLTVGSVSPKTVSQRLKMLEEIGFVERHAYAEIPPRVEYRLTEKGMALVDILNAIKEFGERYLADSEVESMTPSIVPPACE